MNEINNKEELCLALDIAMATTIARFLTKGTFKNTDLYEGHWEIINCKVKRAISLGTGGVWLALTWENIAPSYRTKFISRFKLAHQKSDEAKDISHH